MRPSLALGVEKDIVLSLALSWESAVREGKERARGNGYYIFFLLDVNDRSCLPSDGFWVLQSMVISRGTNG